MDATLKLVFFLAIFFTYGNGLQTCDCERSCVVNNIRSKGQETYRSCDSINVDAQCDPKGQRPFRDFQKEVKTSTFCGEVCVPLHGKSKLCSQPDSRVQDEYNQNSFELGQWQNRGDIESLVKLSSERKMIETRVGEENDSSLEQMNNAMGGIYDLYDEAFVGNDYGDEGEDDDSDIDIYIDNAFEDKEDETAASFMSQAILPNHSGAVSFFFCLLFSFLYAGYTFIKSKPTTLSTQLLPDFEEL